MMPSLDADHNRTLYFLRPVSYTHGMRTADISLVYQDHHLLIVNKPAGIVIHPTYKHTDGTLWNRLLVYLAEQGGDDWCPPELPDEPEWAQAPSLVREMLRQRRLKRLWKEEGLLPRPSLLHRLDKDTSGIVALGRTENSRRHIIRQFHNHTIVKRYLAVVQPGAPDWAEPEIPLTILRRQSDGREEAADASFVFSSLESDSFVLDGPLQRDPDDRRRCIVGPAGQVATTVVKVLAVENGFALLDVRPVTGRTHQIRAHLAALGYAIVGDQTYALPAKGATPAAALSRQFLHAYSMTVRQYPDDKLSTFVAPLADDLASWLACYFPAAMKYIIEHAAETE